MSNIDIVKGILRHMITPENPTHVQDIANELADAGLLMPDLPAPTLKYDDGGACWLDNENTSVEYHPNPDSDVCITTGVAHDLTPTEACQLAYALLAAAQFG